MVQPALMVSPSPKLRNLSVKTASDGQLELLCAWVAAINCKLRG